MKHKIEINGRNLECSFGLGFLGECLENLNLAYYEIGDKVDKNPYKWLPILIYESAKYPDKELDFELKDLIEWLDNSEGTDIIAKFFKEFLNSFNKDVPKSKEVKGPKKK